MIYGWWGRLHLLSNSADTFSLDYLGLDRCWSMRLCATRSEHKASVHYHLHRACIALVYSGIQKYKECLHHPKTTSLSKATECRFMGHSTIPVFVLSFAATKVERQDLARFLAILSSCRKTSDLEKGIESWTRKEDRTDSGLRRHRTQDFVQRLQSQTELFSKGGSARYLFLGMSVHSEAHGKAALSVWTCTAFNAFVSRGHVLLSGPVWCGSSLGRMGWDRAG